MSLKNYSTTFKWSSRDHIEVSESQLSFSDSAGSMTAPWDSLNLNSADKNEDEHYLLSGCFTDTIYKVSGQNGSILWRLGGKHSSFHLEGFNLSRQHHARFISENRTTTVISFLDSGTDSCTKTSKWPSAKYVALDKSSGTARVVKQFDRPGHKLSTLRGNVQTLPNGNTFVGWSDNAVISEFAPDGELLLNAESASCRFDTYRAYKFEWKSTTPPEPIAVKAFAYGTNQRTATTMVYVS